MDLGAHKLLCALDSDLKGYNFAFRRKILSPHFSPPLERKGGVDQSTPSFTEPKRPSTSHNYVRTTMQQQSSGTGLGRSRETEGEEGEEENLSDDEVRKLQTKIKAAAKNCTC